MICPGTTKTCNQWPLDPTKGARSKSRSQFRSKMVWILIIIRMPNKCGTPPRAPPQTSARAERPPAPQDLATQGIMWRIHRNTISVVNKSEGQKRDDNVISRLVDQHDRLLRAIIYQLFLKCFECNLINRMTYFLHIFMFYF